MSESKTFDNKIFRFCRTSRGVGRMKFKAKPMPDYEPFEHGWLEEKMDDDGYVTGYYVDGYIVGDFAEVNEEYTHLEFWVPVLKDTLQQVEELEE